MIVIIDDGAPVPGGPLRIEYEYGTRRWEWEVEALTMLNAGERVSVRVQHDGREWFGTGLVVQSAQLGEGYARSRIVGDGPLGERPCKPRLATLEGM